MYYILWWKQASLPYLLGLRIITSHLFTLIMTAQSIDWYRHQYHAACRNAGRRSATRLSVLAKDVMMNKQQFLLEGSGRLFKANAPNGGNTVILNYPSVSRRNLMIWCYGSSGDLHLLQPNNAQNVTAEALRNLSRGAERLGDTFKLSSNPLP